MIATAVADATNTHPTANVLFDGFRTKLDRFPESTEVVYERRQETYRALSPRNPLQVWFTDDIGLMQIRLEQTARMERRERDRSALRAEFFWDDDRRILADDLGARLFKDPTRILNRLKATPQGCDWLLQRWGWLQGVLDAGKTWDDGHNALVFDLLGIAAGFRDVEKLADPAKLVCTEVAALVEQKAKVAEADALDRNLAMADMVNPNTVEFRRLRRYEGACIRRMKWDMEQLELMPKYANPHPGLTDYPDRSSRPPVQPDTLEVAVAVLPPEPQPEPEPEPQPETPAPIPLFPVKEPAATTERPVRRPDPAKLRAKMRQADRQRREARAHR